MAWELVIQVRAPKNRAVLFPPTDSNLESDWRADQHLNACQEVRALGEIPGHELKVSFKDKKALLHHRMHDATPEFDRALRKAIRSDANGIGINFTHYPPDQEFEIVTEDDRATWLWWIKRNVDRNRFVLKQGSLPSYDEIRRMGNVKTCSEDLSMEAKPGRPPIGYLPKIVDDKREPATAGKV